ncbi:3792_t:CDS:1, partial [Acaulospora colombiana]
GPSRPDQDQTLQMNASNTRQLRRRRRLQKRPRSLSAHANSIALSPQDPAQDLVTNNPQNNGKPQQEPYHPAWKIPKTPMPPFPVHLPDEILRSIFEYAATDLDTACALVLVAFHVRTWVDPILYSRVRLEGLEPIRLFARTIEATLALEASIS